MIKNIPENSSKGIEELREIYSKKMKETEESAKEVFFKLKLFSLFL